ncbi:histidinol dehydrogenase, partial [Acidimicrobiaceae bacterium]|nr:histidinol dehydrogenase [Acidimicrobiaceae bacterium]
MLKELDVRGDLEKSISEYLPRPFSKENNEEIVVVVKGIIEEVRKRGDEALYEMTERFDGSRPRTLSVGRQEMENAL